MLRRIHIRGFKSLHDVEVELSPLVVVLGPNASGKSNFLEALQLLARVGTAPTLRAAFEEACRGFPQEAFELPEDGLPGLLKQEGAAIRFDADIDVAPSKDGARTQELRYVVNVQILPASGSLSHSSEITPTRRQRAHDRKKLHTPGDREEMSKVVARRHSRSVHLRTELESWRTYYLDPRNAMRAAQPPREVSDIGSRGEFLGSFLYRLKHDKDHPHHFAAVVRAIRAAIPSIDSVDVQLNDKRAEIEIEIIQNGTPFSSRVVSEGTLRVLALCALAGNPWPASLLSFEEPENGVHPRRIQVVAKLLASMTRKPARQVIVTTHSPELVGAVVRLAREGDIAEGGLRLLRCSERGGRTNLVPLDPALPILHDAEVAAALNSPDDARVIEEMLLRGWLDG